MNPYREKYQPEPDSRLDLALQPAEQTAAQLEAVNAQIARLESARAGAMARVRALQRGWAADATEDADAAIGAAKKRVKELDAAKADAAATGEALAALHMAQKTLQQQAQEVAVPLHSITDPLDRVRRWLQDAETVLARKQAAYQAALEREEGRPPEVVFANLSVPFAELAGAEAALVEKQRVWDRLANFYLAAPQEPVG